MALKLLNVRLPVELYEQLALVSKVLDEPMSALLVAAGEKMVQEKVQSPEFATKLAELNKRQAALLKTARGTA